MFRDYGRVVVLAFVLAAIAVQAQTPQQQTAAFDVASVKESTTDDVLRRAWSQDVFVVRPAFTAGTAKSGDSLRLAAVRTEKSL